MAARQRTSNEEAKISISIPTLLTLLGLMVTIMLAIAGAVAGMYQSVFIPAERSESALKIDNLQRQYQDQVKLYENSQEALRKVVAANAKLVEVAGNPILLYPKDDQIVIAKSIRFEWSYKSEKIPHFIIEITRFTSNGLKYATYSVLQPQNHIFEMPITGDGDVGQYLWRVRPGLLREDHTVETGPWSAYQSFWVFTSVKQKIQHVRRMTVGMYPSFSDNFNRALQGGKYEGLSVDLAHFIADELTARWPKIDRDTTDQIKVEIVSFAFQDLLNEVKSNSVDMIISSMTATKARETEFGVLFSKGYFVAHHLLLSNQLTFDSRLSLFDNLKKKRIGAMKGTTNERAAYYLADTCKCGLVVRPDYQELIESKSALFRQEVDLLLADDIWEAGLASFTSFKQFGPALDEQLSKFYVNEYGRSQNEYGIAFSKTGGDEILQAVNEILDNNKTKSFINAIASKAKGQISQSSRD
jgi:ABC-type amino acid transport substrate-binding protein